MKHDEAIRLCDRYIENLDENKVKRLIRADSMLYRHNILNKILIDIQNKDGTIKDVRTMEEWYILGRKVIDRSKGIALLASTEGVSYYDADTGRKIAHGELNSDEINIGIKAGIIRKESRVTSTKVIAGYDVGNTEEIETGMYLQRIEPGLFLMSTICKKLYGKEFTVDRRVEDDNNIFVPKDVNKAIEIIINTYINENKHECDNKMLEYSLNTMFGFEKDVRIDADIVNIEHVGNIIGRILDTGLCILGFNQQAYENIKNVEESKVILNILNYILFRKNMEV